MLLSRLFKQNMGEELTPEKAKRVPVFVWVFLALTFVGFLDALYLAIKKIYSGPISCFIFTGCETVQNSVYGNFIGIPVAFWGAGFFLILMFLIIRFIEARNRAILKLFFYLTIPGAAFALYLFFLQFFVIKALCIYCIITDGIALYLFAASYIKTRSR